MVNTDIAIANVIIIRIIDITIAIFSGVIRILLRNTSIISNITIIVTLNIAIIITTSAMGNLIVSVITIRLRPNLIASISWPFTLL